jgi:hypothetical protein
LDQFDDYLYGGMGTPDGGFSLLWRHTDSSRQLLGDYLFDSLVEIIQNHPDITLTLE